MKALLIEPPAPPVALLQEAPLRELIVARVVSNVIAIGGSSGFVLNNSLWRAQSAAGKLVWRRQNIRILGNSFDVAEAS